jgi:hypothetical protein
VNQLHFPLKAYKKRNGKYVLLIYHPNCQRKKTNATREFANWLRGHDTSIVTEFRSVPSYVVSMDQYVDWWRDPHFVAYDVPARVFMMIKLAWSYTSKKMTMQTKAVGALRYPVDNYGYLGTSYHTPTAKALARHTAKKPVKLLKVDQ